MQKTTDSLSLSFSLSLSLSLSHSLTPNGEISFIMKLIYTSAAGLICRTHHMKLQSAQVPLLTMKLKVNLAHSVGKTAAESYSIHD